MCFYVRFGHHEHLARETGFLEIVVQLNQGAASELTRATEASSASEQSLPGLEDLGLALEPMHPGASDPALAAYFTVEVPDAEAADRALEALRRSDVVEAAYMKPSAEPP
jgi:hypothetical protein